jgi:hypothetical protein
LLGLEDRRLPLPGQILEVARGEQRLVELSALEIAHIGERRMRDLLDAATQRGAAIGRA